MFLRRVSFNTGKTYLSKMKKVKKFLDDIRGWSSVTILKEILSV